MNKNNLQSFLKQRFPSSQISFAGEGWGSIAFIVDDNIIRFPKDGIDGYKKESKITNFVRGKVLVQVPDINIIEDSEYPYSVHKMLHGNSWNFSDFDSIDSDKLKSFAKDCAQFFTNIHSIGLDEAKNSIPELIETKPHIVPFEKIVPFLDRLLPISEINTLNEYHLAACANSSGDIVLLHSDFSGGNTLIDNNFRLTGVFDWGNSNFGERAFDFLRLYSPNHTNLLNHILNEYKKLTNISIDIERVRELVLIETVSAAYYANMPDMTDMRDKEMIWIIDRLRWWL